MDIGRALTFFTEEERWIEKTTIGTLVILVSLLLSSVVVGVVGFFILTGYGLRLMRNVQRGVRPVLPEWDQWGDDLGRGFKLVVVSLVWGLPVIVVTLPTIVGAAMLDSGSEGAAVFGLMLLLCGTCLSLAYGLFLALVQPGFTIAFARDENIRSGLAFTEIWRWTRSNIGDVAVVAIVYVVGSLIISTVAVLVGTVACLIGLVVTMPLGTLIVTYFQYHLYGQLPAGAFGGVGGGEGGYAPDFDSGFGTTSASGMAGGVTVTPQTPPTVGPDPVVGSDREDATSSDSSVDVDSGMQAGEQAAADTRPEDDAPSAPDDKDRKA